MTHEIRLHSIHRCVYASRYGLQRIVDTKDCRFRKSKRNKYLRALAIANAKRGYVAIGTIAEMREKFGRYFDYYTKLDFDRICKQDTRKYIWSLTDYCKRRDISIRWYPIY